MSRSITLQWTEPHHNNAPVTHYIVSFTDPDFLGGEERTASSTEDMVVVTGLHPGVEYVFTVVAVNEEGPSQPSNNERATTKEEGNYFKKSLCSYNFLSCSAKWLSTECISHCSIIH